MVNVSFKACVSLFIFILVDQSIGESGVWRLNNMLLNNQEITEEIKEEIKKHLDTMTMKTWQPKTYGMQQKQF